MNLKIMFGVLFNVFELINKLRIIASPLNLTAHTTLTAKARAHATWTDVRRDNQRPIQNLKQLFDEGGGREVNEEA